MNTSLQVYESLVDIMVRIHGNAWRGISIYSGMYPIRKASIELE